MRNIIKLLMRGSVEKGFWGDDRLKIKGRTCAAPKTMCNYRSAWRNKRLYRIITVMLYRHRQTLLPVPPLIRRPILIYIGAAHDTQRFL